MRKVLLSLVLATTMLTSGCGTLWGAHITGRIHPMSGVKWDVKFIACEDNYTSVPVNLLFILDLPFSFLYDLLIMPAAIACGDN